MTKQTYTLKDKIFRDGIYFSILSGSQLKDFPKLFMVGGGATQIIAQKNPDLLRATTDIDVIPCGYLPNSARKAWAKKTSKIANAEGYSTVGRVGVGGEVRFSDCSPAFLLHLDCFGKSRQTTEEKRAELEYMRAGITEIRGLPIRYQCPEDNIAKKFTRAKHLVSSGRADNSGERREFFGAILDLYLEDLMCDKGTLKENLERVEEMRTTNVEELSREGFQNMVRRIVDYKVEKDMYDIKLVLYSVKQSRGQIDEELLKRSIEDLLPTN